MVFQSLKTLFVLSILCFGSTSICRAQYFQFSQYNFTDLRVNPAIPGTSKFASLSIDYRNQKTAGDYNLNSSYISASYPLLNQSTGRPWAGIGINLMDDRSAGLFKTQEAALSYSVNVELTRYQQLSFGVKGLFQTRSVNMDGLFTEAQYVEDHGFNPGMANGEHLSNIRTNLYTLSAGMYWQEVDRKGRITEYWGLSLFDFNKPNNSFSGSDSQMPASFVFTGGFEAYRKKEFSIFPEILFTRSASTNLLNVGTRFGFEVKPMPNQVAARVDLITKYVLGKSGIAGIQLHRENFTIGFSYDFPVIVKNAANVGAFEIGLQWRRPVETRTRLKEIARRKKNPPVKAKPGPSIPEKALVGNPPENQITIDTVKFDSVRRVVGVDSATRKPTVDKGAQAGPIKQEPMLVEKITLHFQFHYNSSDLDDATEKFLDDLSITLKEDPELKIKVVGHTDNIGPDKFNQRLSMKRAESVRNFLLQQGIPAARLVAEGKGMTEPVDSNDTEEGRARNRRVELMVYHDN